MVGLMVIYKTTNLINNKIYIGKDSKNNPNYLGNGKENFKKEILKHCSSREELDRAEKYWIKKLNAIEKGYNIAEGGTGGRTRQNYIGRKWTKEQRIKKSRSMGGPNNHNYKKTMPEEQNVRLER